MRSAALLFALALAVNPAAVSQTAKAGALPPQAEKLPPISYCPMHPGLEGKAAPVRSARWISCRSGWIPCGPRDAALAVIQENPGRCQIDGTALVQVTAAVSWSCPGSGVESVSPGTCRTARRCRRAARARALNHNPQHGGLFFMATTIRIASKARICRRACSGCLRRVHEAAEARRHEGHQGDLDGEGSRTSKDTTFSLVRSGRYLQAAIGKLPLPAEMYAKVKFTPDGKDNRFDFAFPAYSKEPHAAPNSTMTNAVPSPSVATPAAAAPSPSPDISSGIDPALVPLPIPETVPEMLAQLKARTDQVGSLIDRGTFAAIYVPAFQAKDLALALDEHKNELTPERRKIAEPAIARLVRSAYLLDAFGDIGNKQQITEAYSKFVEAAKDIHSAFPQSATPNPQ
jgi:hypothetical protein